MQTVSSETTVRRLRYGGNGQRDNGQEAGGSPSVFTTAFMHNTQHSDFEPLMLDIISAEAWLLTVETCPGVLRDVTLFLLSGLNKHKATLDIWFPIMPHGTLDYTCSLWCKMSLEVFLSL